MTVWKDHNVTWKSGILFNTLVPAHVANRVGFNTGSDCFDPAVDVSDSPFRVASYSPGRYLTLVGNERCWGYPDAPPNQLIAASNADLDNARRFALLDQTHRILRDDLPIVPLDQALLLLAVRYSLTNIEPNPSAPTSPFWDTEQSARKAR